MGQASDAVWSILTEFDKSNVAQEIVERVRADIAPSDAFLLDDERDTPILSKQVATTEAEIRGADE